MSQSDRIAWVDIARGIGIILVVFGHTWHGLKAAGKPIDPTVYEFVYAWIYSFHMPLFFVLSGLFAGRSAARPARTYIADKLRTILYPYLLWSFLQGSLNVLLSRSTNLKIGPLELLGNILIGKYGQFWFLYVLMILFLAFLPLAKLRLNAWAILAMAVAVRLAMARYGGGSLPAFRTAARDGVFFAIGHLAATIRFRPLAAAPLMVLVAGTIAAAAVVTASTAGVFPAEPLGIPTTALIGTAGVVAASVAIERLGGSSLLVALGQASLPIYVAHVLASAGTRIVLDRLGIQQLAIHLILGNAAGLFVPLLADLVVRKYRIRYVFSALAPAPA